MAHPHDRQSVARPVRTRFEPSHLAPTCLVDAYARLVPLRRRVRSALLSAGSLDAVDGSGRTASLGWQQEEEGQRCS
jgi:hypothetical protein